MFGTNTPFQVPALQSPVEPMTHQSSGHTSEDPDSYDLLPLCYKPLKLCNLFLIPENHVSKEPMKIMTFNAQKKIIYEVYFKESHDITSEYILIYIPAKTCFNTSVTSPNEPPRVVHPMFIPTNRTRIRNQPWDLKPQLLHPGLVIPSPLKHPVLQLSALHWRNLCVQDLQKVLGHWHWVCVENNSVSILLSLLMGTTYPTSFSKEDRRLPWCLDRVLIRECTDGNTQPLIYWSMCVANLPIDMGDGQEPGLQLNGK